MSKLSIHVFLLSFYLKTNIVDKKKVMFCKEKMLMNLFFIKDVYFFSPFFKSLDFFENFF